MYGITTCFPCEWLLSQRGRGSNSATTFQRRLQHTLRSSTPGFVGGAETGTHEKKKKGTCKVAAAKNQVFPSFADRLLACYIEWKGQRSLLHRLERQRSLLHRLEKAKTLGRRMGKIKVSFVVEIVAAVERGRILVEYGKMGLGLGLGSRTPPADTEVPQVCDPKEGLF